MKYEEISPPPLETKWMHRFMQIAKEVAAWSKDPSTKVGAVLVSRNKQILSTGYNGFPANIEDKEEWYNDRSIKYDLTVHAELNTILNAAKNGVNIKDSILFVTSLPVCKDCAKHVAQAGISAVVKEDIPVDLRWKESNAIAEKIFSLSGIPIYKI